MAEHRAEPAPARPRSEGDLGSRLEALPDSGWQTLESQRFGFRVTLPDAANWRPRQDERWFELGHEPSRSLIRFRTWQASPRASRQECAEQVYLWNRELRPQTEPMLERPLNAPQGYDVVVGIYLTDLGAGGQGARAQAIGAAVRRCYAAIYDTRAAEERELAARLQLVVEQVLGRVELRGLEEVVPEPFPAR